MAGLTPKQEAWPIDRPQPYPANPRQITDKAIAKVATSIREFGFQQPIVVDTQGVIIAGHTRLAAAKQLQLAQVPVIIADLPEAKARAYRLADNRTAQETSWLDDLLGEELTALQELDFDLDAIGFDEAELRALMSDDEELDRAEQTPDVPEEAVSKLGDLWHLGEHRVYCGDATNAGHVAQVLESGSADLCFTSPPYAEQRDYGGDLPDWDALMNGVFANLPVKDGAQVLVNLGLVHDGGRVDTYWNDWLDFMAGQGWPLFGWYVWDQGHGMPGNWNGRLAPSHEFIFHFARNASQSNKWVSKKSENIRVPMKHEKYFRQKDGTFKQLSSLQAVANKTKVADSVIRVNRRPSETSKMGHPATFPVELCLNIYKSYAKAGDTIYEPFAGSGTAFIASEMFGATCCGLELHPPYVDVIVQRWQDFTGREAMRLDGKTFDELKADTIGTAAGQHRPGRSNQQAMA